METSQLVVALFAAEARPNLRSPAKAGVQD